MHPNEFVFPWWGLVPFAALLGSMATFPLLPGLREWWKSGWFQLGVSLTAGLPAGLWMWFVGNRAGVGHALVEYGQFMVLIFSLFVVSGGIHIRGDIQATPRSNTLLLGIGALLASVIGTTGAAMVMIRPILKINHQRKHLAHTVIFTIFTVANCGGLLTPLGDPPLFLGLLRGVPFTWTLHLWPEWLFVNGLLLFTYWSLDRGYYAKEPEEALRADAGEIEPIQIEGKLSIGMLLLVVVAVALLPSVNTQILFGEPTSQATPLAAYLPIRELGMLSCAGVSYFLGERRVRFEENEFHFLPILEVGALFIGIFLAMIPALAYLDQVAPSFPLNSVSFFAFSGSLSAVLDNAPTYATFFEIAGRLGGEPSVAGVSEVYLASISLGSVMGGALTYIGNGPNFMVKSIADAQGVLMPSFGAYALFWAARYLLPILVLMVLVFIAPAPWANFLGVALTAGWIGWRGLRGMRKG